MGLQKLSPAMDAEEGESQPIRSMTDLKDANFLKLKPLNGNVRHAKAIKARMIRDTLMWKENVEPKT